MENNKQNTIDELREYREKLSKLTDEEQRQRDLYLKRLADGTLQGPLTMKPSIDKVFLGQYNDEDINEVFPEQNLYDFLKEKNKDNMNNVMIDYYNKQIKTKDVFNDADKIAKILVNDYQINEGDIISICMPATPETYSLFLAINQIGAIANFIDPRINEERINDCIGEKSKMVFAVNTFSEKIDNASKKYDIPVISLSPAQSLSSTMKFVYNLKAKPKKVRRFVEYGDFIKGKDKNSFNDITKSEYKKNSPAAIVYTSGTTGVPKGAMLSNDNIISVALHQVKNVPDMEKGDIYLVIMPPFIAYGLVCGICCPMSTCQRMRVIPKFEASEFPNLVNKFKPNHMLGVPSFFESLIESPLFNNKDLSFIKYCIVGGDKMTVESEKRINNFFKDHNVKNKVVKGYGMTELSSAAISTHSDEENKLGSAGIPYVKNNVKILDPSTNNEVSYNEVGEVYISSPSMMVGYDNNSSEQEKVIIKDEYGKSWVKTGDLGSIDLKGNVTIAGRIKRMIIRPDGHNVFPSAIEELLVTHPGVASCVVVGVKNPKFTNGSIPTAVIVLKDEYKSNNKEVIQELIDLSSIKLPPRDVALEYKIVDEIPFNSVGKVDFKLLEETLSNESLKNEEYKQVERRKI